MKTADSIIELIRDDITRLDVDAIVNAANTALSAAAEWMARFIGPLEWNCLQNVERSAVADPEKQN